MLLAAVGLLPGVASAEGSRVGFLKDRLGSDDFRVRTNAALALGATEDEAAVAPLCQSLADPSDVVRQASAVGLERLHRASALGCLQARESVEGDEIVKSQIARAAKGIQASAPRRGGPDAYRDSPKAK